MLARASLAGTLLSGLPSTAWTFLAGANALEPTRAAGSMLLPVMWSANFAIALDWRRRL